MRRFQRLTFWLYQRIAVILSILLVIGTGVALSGTFELSEDLVDAQALQHARASVHTVKEAWFLYSQSAVDRLDNVDAVTISPEYHQMPGGIPLPATYTIELGERVSKAASGTSFRLYSDYPFPHRQSSGGPHNLFEQEALKYLQENPTRFFARKDKEQDHLLFRYAEAMPMESSCVKCHNTWPTSPKTDWQVGDVRGVLEVIQSIDPFIVQAQGGLERIWLTFIMIGCLALIGFILVISYLQNANRILQLSVAEKTSVLNRLAHLDSLTGLGNRRCFDQVLEQECQRMQQQQQSLSLMMCDVDFFKSYNDTYGHQAGDECLQKIAQVINANVRSTRDFATRYGGEEFAVIMPNTDYHQAVTVAEAIQKAMIDLQVEHLHSQVAAQVTLSIGIVCALPRTTFRAPNLVKVADKALYEAKIKGRNQIIVKRPHVVVENHLS